MTTEPRLIAAMPSATEVVVVREVDAPPSLVFDAWTALAIARWYGGDPGRYVEHQPPRRLVIALAGPAATIEVSFVDHDGRTVVTVRHRFTDAPARDDAVRDGLIEAWSGRFVRLDAVFAAG
ncbi:MAG: SRPBCC domain-containing protein [Myxococcota bacterium]